MGWFVVSICLPLLAPLFGLFILSRLPLPQSARSRLNYLVPFKDGQLCWIAIGFCASALYEVAVLAPYRRAVPEAAAGWINGWLIVLLVTASLIAAGGSIFPTRLHRPSHTSWFEHFSCFTSSLFLTVAAAASYALIHYRWLYALPIFAISGEQ